MTLTTAIVVFVSVYIVTRIIVSLLDRSGADKKAIAVEQKAVDDASNAVRQSKDDVAEREKDYEEAKNKFIKGYPHLVKPDDSSDDSGSNGSNSTSH